MARKRKVEPEDPTTPRADIVEGVKLPGPIEQWPIDKLKPYAQNARVHPEGQVQQIMDSMRRYGFTQPVLVHTKQGIVAGHGRYDAARGLQLRVVPVIRLDHLTEEEIRAYRIADNQIALNSDWDPEMLQKELGELDRLEVDLEGLGFDEEELAMLLAPDGVPPVRVKPDPDAVPEPPTDPTSRAGDVWSLGKHRLMCGDSLKRPDVLELLEGQLADMVFTDPPYNVDYEGYTAEKLTIKSDSMSRADFKQFLRSTFLAYRAVVKPQASIYVCHPSSWQREFESALQMAGFAVRCQIIWAKNTFAWGHGRYKFQHEPIFYGYVNGQSDRWFGDKSQSTLWEENKPSANRIHPTAKPVELIERALVNSSKPKELIVDLFGGSGSTLIACERLDRVARLMELEPKYADCIVVRWQELTGREALHKDGRRYAQHVKERRQASKEPKK